MPKTIKNKYFECLTYDKLMKAHKKTEKGKRHKEEVIKFNLKQEEYIIWLLEQLKNKTYKHSGYKTFYITKPKLRKIEKSRYIDRIVHRWYVDNFIKPYFEPQYINKSFACIKNRGTHKACLEVQKGMKKCKKKWNNYYILKMDVTKYFQNIDKQILLKILKRKIKDKNILWLTNEIINSTIEKKGIPIRKLQFPMFCQHILKRIRSIYKT